MFDRYCLFPARRARRVPSSALRLAPRTPAVVTTSSRQALVETVALGIQPRTSQRAKFMFEFELGSSSQDPPRRRLASAVSHSWGGVGLRGLQPPEQIRFFGAE